MLMRVFQVTTHEGKETQFADFFHKTAIPLMQKTPGLVALYPGAARGTSPREFCMVMVWKDLDALKAFVGEDYENPYIHADEADVVASRTIKHYEFVDLG